MALPDCVMGFLCFVEYPKYSCWLKSDTIQRWEATATEGCCVRKITWSQGATLTDENGVRVDMTDHKITPVILHLIRGTKRKPERIVFSSLVPLLDYFHNLMQKFGFWRLWASLSTIMKNQFSSEFGSRRIHIYILLRSLNQDFVGKLIKINLM